MYEQRALDEEDGEPVLGDVEVFATTEADWYRWDDLAPFAILRKELYWWNTMESTHDACYWLRDRERAVPRIPLMDRKCSALMLVESLTRLKWKGVLRSVVHVPPLPPPGDERIFDCREAVKQKHYYQVRHGLPDLFEYANRVPSTEVVSFFTYVV